MQATQSITVAARGLGVRSRSSAAPGLAFSARVGGAAVQQKVGMTRSSSRSTVAASASGRTLPIDLRGEFSAHRSSLGTGRAARWRIPVASGHPGFRSGICLPTLRRLERELGACPVRGTELNSRHLLQARRRSSPALLTTRCALRALLYHVACGIVPYNATFSSVAGIRVGDRQAARRGRLRDPRRYLGERFVPTSTRLEKEGDTILPPGSPGRCPTQRAIRSHRTCGFRLGTIISGRLYTSAW